MFLIGEAFGEHEAKLNRPFVGPTGTELLKLLNKAQILSLTSDDYASINLFYRTYDPRHIHAVWSRHPHIHLTNVFQLRPPNNDIKYFCGPKSSSLSGYPPLGSAASGYVQASFAAELTRLNREITAYNPNCIVCLGATALWALTGSTKISQFRGYTALASYTSPGCKLLPTYHPTTIFHKYSLRPIVIADLMKAHVQNQFPDLRRPAREIWIEPTLADIQHFFTTYCQNAALLSVDIETYGPRVTCIGFSPRPDLALVIPFEPAPDSSPNYWATPASEVEVWREIKTILEDSTIPKLFQNGLYDISFLWRSMRIAVMGASEDSMLLHHAIQPEMEKGLGFLGSLYSDERQWKNMRKHHTIKRDD